MQASVLTFFLISIIIVLVFQYNLVVHNLPGHVILVKRGPNVRVRHPACLMLSVITITDTPSR